MKIRRGAGGWAGIAAGIGAVALTIAIAACSGAAFFFANAPTVFGSYKRVTNLPYGAGPRQHLDVYVPREARGRPVVIFWYGGSWTQGNKSQYRFVGAALAQRGFVAVLPDYRLFPEVRFPEVMDDGARAVAWVQQHAQEFGGDPDRLVLMGHSAGAHMAALLALDESYLARAGVRPKSIIALIGLSGPYALDPNSETLRATFGPPSTPAEWQPVQHVSTTSPPTLLMHGLEDKVVNVQHANKLHDALLRHSVPVQLYLYPDRGHADTLASFSLLARSRTPSLDQTIRFLDSVSARSDPSH